MSMDNYPQARKGVDLLFKAQVAAIVGTILTAILPLIGAIITIIALVINLVGLKQAGKDDEGYRKALTFTIVAFVVEIAAGIITSFEGVAMNVINIILTGAEEVFTILIALYVIRTTTKLLHYNRDSHEEEYGKKVLTVYIVMNVVTFIATILTTIFANNDTLAVIFSIITVVCSLVYMIMYMVFLNKARKTL